MNVRGLKKRKDLDKKPRNLNKKERRKKKDRLPKPMKVTHMATMEVMMTMKMHQ